MKKPTLKSGASVKPSAESAKSRRRVAHESRFYGIPLPGVPVEELTGKLIVIEGCDGSGRSTQIALLTEWLESAGFAVQTMGLRRSNLMARNIEDILERNSVTRLTLSLIYATDLFDQIEHQMIPALRSGFVVLADRYIYSLMARAAVRGVARGYLDGIYQPAVRPDLTFYLNVSPDNAFQREIEKSDVISYWEAGRDMSLSNDLYESFVIYQTRVRAEFDRMAQRHGFIDVDGNARIQDVNRKLRQSIARKLGIHNTRYRPSPALHHLWR